MSGETLGAFGAVIGVVLSALATAAVLVINARAANRLKEAEQEAAARLREKEQGQKEQAGAIAELEKIIGRYERQADRFEAHAGGQAALIERLRESNAALRERLAATEGRYEMVANYARRQAEMMQRHGLHPELPPQSPPPPPAGGPTSEEIDFEIRQSKQASGILKSLSPKPPKEAGPHAESGPGS